MFESFKIKRAIKKGATPYCEMMNTIREMFNKFGAKDITNDNLSFFLAWFNLLYMHCVSRSESEQIGIVMHIKASIEHYEDEFTAEQVLKCRSQYTDKLNAQTRKFYNNPAFYILMSELAFQYLKDNSINTDYETIMYYERKFIKKFGKSILA